MSEDIDVLIERKENELSPLRQCMEELKTEFIKETVSFVSEWYKRTTKEYVTKYPEVTLSMKEEQIAQMKAQVKELIQDAEKIVRGELEKPALWWHQRPACTIQSNSTCKLAINILKSSTAPLGMCWGV